MKPTRSHWSASLLNYDHYTVIGTIAQGKRRTHRRLQRKVHARASRVSPRRCVPMFEVSGSNLC